MYPLREVYRTGLDLSCRIFHDARFICKPRDDAGGFLPRRSIVAHLRARARAWSRVPAIAEACWKNCFLATRGAYKPAGGMCSQHYSILHIKSNLVKRDIERGLAESVQSYPCVCASSFHVYVGGARASIWQRGYEEKENKKEWHG